MNTGYNFQQQGGWIMDPDRTMTRRAASQIEQDIGIPCWPTSGPGIFLRAANLDSLQHMSEDGMGNIGNIIYNIFWLSDVLCMLHLQLLFV